MLSSSLREAGTAFLAPSISYDIFIYVYIYLESDRGHRRLAPPREDLEMVLHEGAVAELDGRPGGHVVEAVLGYPVSPFQLGPRLRPVY